MTGCLLGLVVGDALGAPVEFMTRERIHAEYGRDGIVDLQPWGGMAAGTYTDDGQMALATARGLLDWRQSTRWTKSSAARLDLDALAECVWRRYLEWSLSEECAWGRPGATCLGVLGRGVPQGLDDPVDERGKGCGGVMRVAPVGLVGLAEHTFAAAARCATLTHRHPTSDTCSGFLAHLIGGAVEGLPLHEALEFARQVLVAWPGHEETLDAIDAAQRLAAAPGEAHRDIAQIGRVGVETPTSHGKGWVAEETLGIALYCALRFESDYAAAVTAAVNISGDSDSTGAVTGAIVGAAHGIRVIPRAWRDDVADREAALDVAWRLGCDK